MFKKLKWFFVKKGLKRYVEQIEAVNSSDFCSVPTKADDKLGILEKKEISFSKTLLRFIDQKDMTDVECYKNANIDRKLFSKIRSAENYKPSKNTVLAFAISLKLNLQETEVLLKSAGFGLSNSFITDMVVEYFIEKKRYDIDLVNIALGEYKQQPLGCL